MKAEITKKLGKTGVNLILAVIATVGLRKGTEMLAAKGGTTQKIAAIATLLAGAALQFTKSDIAKTIGIIAMAEGGIDTVVAMITDDAGAVKPDSISQGMAKAVLPGGGALSGYVGMGNLALAESSSDYYMQSPTTNTMAQMTL